MNTQNKTLSRKTAEMNKIKSFLDALILPEEIEHIQTRQSNYHAGTKY